MWRRWHPFDYIVVGASAVRNGGGPNSARVRLPDCSGQGGPLSTHSRFTVEAASFPAARLMSGLRNVENRAHWGALFSRSE